MLVIRRCFFEGVWTSTSLGIGEFLLVSMDLLLSNPPHNVRNVRGDVNSYYNFLTFEGTADAVAFGKQVMGQGAYGHLFRSVLQLGRWAKMLSKARKEEESDSDGRADIATKKGGGKKKAVCEVQVVPLYYTQEVGNMVASIFSRRAHYLNVCEEAVHSCRKASPYGDMLYHGI